MAGVCLIFLVCCIFWKCRAANQRKTKRLLQEHDDLLASMKGDGTTPKTDETRARMAAKYGVRNKPTSYATFE